MLFREFVNESDRWCVLMLDESLREHICAATQAQSKVLLRGAHLTTEEEAGVGSSLKDIKGNGAVGLAWVLGVIS